MVGHDHPPKGKIGNVVKTMPQTAHDWEWFIAPMKMVMTGGMVYGIVLTTLHLSNSSSIQFITLHLYVQLSILYHVYIYPSCVMSLCVVLPAPSLISVHLHVHHMQHMCFYVLCNVRYR